MFLTNKEIVKFQKKGVEFSKVQKSFAWNQNTEKFEEIEVNIQSEIDKFKGMDLKSMIERNIKPELDTKPVYGDTTIFKDVNLNDMYYSAQLEVVSDDEEVKKDDLVTPPLKEPLDADEDKGEVN